MIIKSLRKSSTQKIRRYDSQNQQTKPTASAVKTVLFYFLLLRYLYTMIYIYIYTRVLLYRCACLLTIVSEKIKQIASLPFSLFIKNKSAVSIFVKKLKYCDYRAES